MLAEQRRPYSHRDDPIERGLALILPAIGLPAIISGLRFLNMPDLLYWLSIASAAYGSLARRWSALGAAVLLFVAWIPVRLSVEHSVLRDTLDGVLLLAWLSAVYIRLRYTRSRRK